MTTTMTWEMTPATSRISTTRPRVRKAIGMKANHTALKEDDSEGALKAFRAMVDMQDEKGEW